MAHKHLDHHLHQFGARDGSLFVPCQVNKDIMNLDKKNSSVNQQDHAHQEGQQNNTPPIHDFDGQRRSNTQKQSMSNMMQESPEQKAGRAHEQKEEGQPQQEERQP